MAKYGALLIVSVFLVAATFQQGTTVLDVRKVTFFIAGGHLAVKIDVQKRTSVDISVN